MKLNHLVLQNFRNYKNLDIYFSKRLNVLCGKNAQGKTSILEALYYLSLLTSYRTNQDIDLINYEEKEFQIFARYQTAFRENNLKIKKSQITKKRECSINDMLLSNKDYIGEFKVVAFSPEDLDIIKGEPMNRRRFINIQISRINKYYYSLLVAFNTILKQRNKLLRDIRDGLINRNNICVWDVEYSRVSLEIIRIRQEFLQRFMPLTCSFYTNLAEDNLEILTYEYKSNCNIKISDNENKKDKQDILLKMLDENLENDIKRGSTGIGPHKDDFIFYIAGHDVYKFASQGQQRSIILSLKLAEIKYIQEETNEYPILLLDDVLSELDENKKSKLLDNIPSTVQVFITVTDQKLLPDVIAKIDDIDYFQIKSGMVEL